MNNKNKNPKLVIRTAFSQYRKYLRNVYFSSFMILTLLVVLLQFGGVLRRGALNDTSFLIPMKIVAILFTLEVLFLSYVIIAGKVVVFGNRLVHYSLPFRQTLQFSEINKVVFVESYSYFTDYTPNPQSRIFIKKNNGKLKCYKSITSAFYPSHDIHKVAKLVAKNSGAKLIERKTFAGSAKKLI